MCGICGKLYFNSTQKADQNIISAMASVLNHRGPDDHGIYVDGPVGIGHQRLSIIDVSSAGHQPMSNEDGSIWIVFNGEIYNFEELRLELQGKGHVFASHTDTETIIHLYEEEDTDCLNRLRGMFAFAIWDGRKQRLFIARDRVGKKPLVYTVTDDAVIFASEIKALLQDPSVTAAVDCEALHHYLTYQYVPSPWTMFKGIRKLPPAHSLVVQQGNITTRQYWHLSYAHKLTLPALGDYVDQFMAVFTEAVKIRLRSDVPLGAFLSGGIDSSATVAVMSQLTNRPIKTFSIGFDVDEYNETTFAALVAKKFNTDHTEFIVNPDAISILPKLVWHYNEPFADSSAIPTYYVSKLTREHVTVALNGDGGDESFAGYERYIADKLAGYYEKIPCVVREHIIKRSLSFIPHQENRSSFFRRLKRFVNGISEKAERRYVRWICGFDNAMKNDLYSAAFAEKIATIDSVDLIVNWYAKADASAFLDKTLFVDIMSYLPDDLLVKVDIASMANSLEARSPFLDHKLMEFAAALPPHLKLNGIQSKYLLKKAFSSVLPRSVLYRKKMGFGVPIDRWLRNELKELTYQILLEKRSVERGIFKEQAVRMLIDEHMLKRADHSYRIWALLFLELWYRMFIDKSTVLGV
jgi:asparagine synthase (glutamine-hydrolysing)